MASSKQLGLFALIAAAALCVALCPAIAKSAPQMQAGVLLSGSVKSDTGAKLDGVTVSTRAVGQTITTSVFTDEDGNYYFPAHEGRKIPGLGAGGGFCSRKGRG